MDYKSRLRTRLRNGVSMPWYEQGKAAGVDPSLWTDFINDRYAAVIEPHVIEDIISFTRASTATDFDSTGTLQTYAIDELRFGYDPVTLQPKGIMVEDARTNLIINNTTTGMVNGIVDAGGVLPTGWGKTLRGLNAYVKRVTIKGITSSRIRVYGTPTSSGGCFFTLMANNTTDALLNDVFSSSVYASLQAGNFTNVGSVTFSSNIFSAAIAYLQTIGTVNWKPGLDSTFKRHVGIGTITNAAAAYIQTLIQWSVTSGLAVDFTIDLSAPQLEKDTSPSSIILTSGSAVTRSADVPVNNTLTAVPVSAWCNGGEGTLLVVYSQEYSPSGVDRAAEFWDSSNENHAMIRSSTAAGIVRRTGGVSEFGPNYNQAFISDEVIKAATVFVNNDYAVTAQGGTPVTDVTAIQPSAPNRFYFGLANGPTGSINGRIRELRFYPIRLSDLELERLTTP